MYKNLVPHTLNCNDRLLSLERPKVMGILNATPDSFFSGSRVETERDIAQRSLQILNEGGHIIDIGAYSTRPFATEVSEAEERERMANALRIVRQELPDAVISVDTFRASIAKMSVEEFGADIINDISAGDFDSGMIDTMAQLRVPYIAMHTQGRPQTMQTAPSYDNVVADVVKHLSEKVQLLRQRGIADIVIDPGFGFGKTIAHNFELLRHLEAFHIFKLPILVGISRKSFISKTLNVDTDAALNGTTALHAIALSKGAHILRVHDVESAVQVVTLNEHLQ